MPAPAATAARITSGLEVSIAIGSVVRAISCSITGSTRRKLFLGRHVGRARACRFAADIEHVGALFRHAQTMRDGGLHTVVRAAIGERIGGDIENADHPRAVQPQRASGAIQYRGKQIVRHAHALVRCNNRRSTQAPTLPPSSPMNRR